MYTWNRKKATPITFYRECNEISITPSVTWIESDQHLAWCCIALKFIRRFVQAIKETKRSWLREKRVEGEWKVTGLSKYRRKIRISRNTLNEKLTSDKRRMIVNRIWN